MRESLYIAFIVSLIAASSAFAQESDIEGQIGNQGTITWNTMTDEQKAAIIQWVVSPGAIQKFVSANKADLESFLKSGDVKDKNLQELISFLQDPDDKDDLRTLKHIIALRTAGTLLPKFDKDLKLYRATSTSNPDPAEAKSLKKGDKFTLNSFTPTSLRRKYSEEFLDPNDPKSKIIEITIKRGTQTFVIVYPDFIGDYISTIGKPNDDTLQADDYFYHNVFKKNHPELKDTSAKDFFVFKKKYHGDFMVAYFQWALAPGNLEKAQEAGEIDKDIDVKKYRKDLAASMNDPEFYGEDAEYEMVIFPGYPLKMEGDGKYSVGSASNGASAGDGCSTGIANATGSPSSF